MQQKTSAYIKLASTGEKLHIDNLNADNTGLYKCVAENSEGNDNHQVNVSQGIVAVEAGAPVHLDCITQDSSGPRVRWYFNDKEILNGGRYHIYINHTLSFLSKPRDAGVYKCEVLGGLGNSNRTYHLEVQKPVPVSITAPLNVDINLLKGDSETLVCNAVGVPAPTVQWAYLNFDANVTRTFNIDKSRDLTLTDVDVNDAGYYTCIANNGGRNMSLTYRVYVNVPPSIDKPPKKVIEAVIEDRILVIRCDAHGTPVPTIKWQRNGADLVMGVSNIINVNNRLIIYNIYDVTETSGTYTCIASNIAGTASRDYEVLVTLKPASVSASSQLCIDKGKPSEVKCSRILPTSLSSKIVWFCQDKIYVGDTLKLSGYEDNDTKCVCRVSSFEAEDAVNYAINIKICFAPVFNNKLKTFNTYVLRSNLDCKADGYPLLKITWYKDDVLLPISTDTLRADDVATYKCEVTNNLGTQTRKFKVIREECIIDIKKYTSKQRPFLSKGILRPLTDFNVENDLIRIPKNTFITLECPNNYIILDHKNIYLSSLKVKCKQDSQFETDRRNRKISSNVDLYDFECSEEPRPALRNIIMPCNYLNDYKIINVGYQSSSSFQIMYSVCFNIVSKEITFAQYTLHHFGHRTIRYYEYQNNKYMEDESEIYDCESQRKFLLESFGFDDCNNKCCFRRRQLVNPQDLYPSYEAAAFNNINIVPHSTVCTPNWSEIEERILAKANSNGEKFEIWTGIYDHLQLESFGLIEKEVTIRNKKKIPKLLWKVVYSIRLRAAIAIIQINSPIILDAKEIEKYVMCRDVTDKVKWLHNPDWKDPSKGYTYICRIKDFLHAFNHIIYLKGVKRMLV
ncbi:hemicentin-1-like [Zerene cesonia]|uniref:hemicentin-1-like n=1 Tax=Zerene cesonia TaxID=33412 RepID=UPI0018E514D3|nr:hemicentin-1-like [Zerene cesonia]